MIKYLIIDDEYIAHDIIKGYCDLLPKFQLMKSCYDALEAFEYLNDHPVDLIFLDLNMPKLKGFDFLKTLNESPKVIVTTAYSEFALEGYELNIIDYLLKPFSFERFLKAVNKINKPKSFHDSAQQQTVSNSKSETIFLKNDNKRTQVALADILYLEAYGNYTKVFCEDEMITTRAKISSLLNLLPADQFIRVHKSFIVAWSHIKSIDGNRIIIREEIIPIGKIYKRNVDDLVGK